MSIALNILGIPQDAEEAVNDTYLAVWNTVPPKSPDPLAGYVYKTVRNISLDKLKYNSAEKRNGRYDLSIDELAECIPSAALDEQVEALEFLVKDDIEDLTDIKLKELKLKSGMLIACIVHKDKVIIPSGDDVISRGDTVIIVTTTGQIKGIKEILR